MLDCVEVKIIVLELFSALRSIFLCASLEKKTHKKVIAKAIRPLGLELQFS
jgi:hypothetical protein